MGSVWAAHDLSLDAPCAVKLVDDEKAMDPEVRARFAREARSSAQLRSPHVVQVHDFGDWNGTLFIAMEYLDGESLGARLDRWGTLNPDETYRIVAHVARALMSAHARGIVHRDLKPDNVFLVQEYEEEIAKTLDFGIAHLESVSLGNKATRTGSFLGTPYYVSPEQARGQDIDHRTDLWSLGVIAFQCLTGRHPFESDALGELMGLILYEPLPRPTAFNPKLPPDIDDWWQRAAARDREQRFQSAKELADALGEALGIGAVVNVPTVSLHRPSSSPELEEASGIFTPRALGCPAEVGAPRISSPIDGATGEGGGLQRRLNPGWAAVLWAALRVSAVLGVIALVVYAALRARQPVEPTQAPVTGRAATLQLPSIPVTRTERQHGTPAPEAVPSVLNADMLPLAEPEKASRPVDAGLGKPGRATPSPRSTTPGSARDYGI